MALNIEPSESYFTTQGPTAVPFEFSPSQGMALGLPLFIGLRMHPFVFIQVMQELHAELATESPQGVHIVAHRSGHAIQLDEPELVIDAIRQVVEKVRYGSSS